MAIVKKIDKLVFVPFIKLFFVALFTTLFVIVMQLFMIYFTDFMGKGLSATTYFELTTYIATAASPHAIPLAIMFSSIVSVGSLGESLEIEALKASGVSLVRIIRPLVVFSILLSGLAYGTNAFFVPRVYAKFITLLRDMQNKKPDIAIKEGVFYDGIPGYSVRVAKKNSADNTLEDIMIYDHTRKKDIPMLTVAKKGRIYSKNNGQEFVIELVDGHNYADIADDKEINPVSNPKKFINSTFNSQKLILDLESLGFHRSGEDSYKEFKKSRNIFELKKDISDIDDYKNEIYKLIFKSYDDFFYGIFSKQQKLNINLEIKNNLYALRSFLSNENNKSEEDYYVHRLYMQNAISNAKQSAEAFSKYLKKCKRQEISQEISIRDYKIELLKMFTWAFSCFTVMILGATLGAIMKRGGLGIPLITSGILIVIHYIIEMISEKWGKHGIISPFFGAWASNLVIVPLCILFYYMAYRDISLPDFKIYNLIVRKFSKKPK